MADVIDFPGRMDVAWQAMWEVTGNALRINAQMTAAEEAELRPWAEDVYRSCDTGFAFDLPELTEQEAEKVVPLVRDAMQQYHQANVSGIAPMLFTALTSVKLELIRCQKALAGPRPVP